MLVRDLTQFLEQIAPLSLQESYDNAGLITGDPNWKVKAVLVSLDTIEKVVDEAIAKKCNVIVAHHPIVFRGLKQLNGKNYVERTIIKAIKNDIAIYAIHTNLDNVLSNGVNQKIGERLGLINTRILSPKEGLERAVIYSPIEISDQLRQSFFALGLRLSAGSGYDYSGLGISNEGARSRIDFQYAKTQRRQVIKIVSEYGDRVSYDLIPLANKNPMVGSGLIGDLPDSVAEREFLGVIKKKMKTSLVRHTKLRNRRIRKVALCGGSGSFLLGQAKAQGADLFLTADFKYHEFFDAENQLVIADIGHYETEQFTIDLLQHIISEKFSTFAVYCTEVNTNPVHYF